MITLGAAIGRRLPNGTVLTLSGTLGSGKTTFVRGLARGLGVRSRVVSPTFILCAVHKARRVRWFCHADFYRIRSDRNLPLETLREYLGAKDTITAIEWPERIARSLPKNAIRLYFSHHGKNARRITLTHAEGARPKS